MANQLTTQPTQARVMMKSWGEAYKSFLKSPDESFGLKILPLIALGVLPLSLADDILVPFLGIADDIPTSLLILFTVFRTWQRVRHHR